MVPIENMNGLPPTAQPGTPDPEGPHLSTWPRKASAKAATRMWHRAEAPFFSENKKEPTSASTDQGNRTPAQKAMPDPHPALPRTETGDPPLKRGRRPGFPPGRCRTWDFSSGEGGAQRPPPTGNPAITGPQVCKQTQRGRTQPGPRGFARRPGNPCSAQNCMEAAVKRTPSPLHATH